MFSGREPSLMIAKYWLRAEKIMPVKSSPRYSKVLLGESVRTWKRCPRSRSRCGWPSTTFSPRRYAQKSTRSTPTGEESSPSWSTASPANTSHSCRCCRPSKNGCCSCLWPTRLPGFTPNTAAAVLRNRWKPTLWSRPLRNSETTWFASKQGLLPWTTYLQNELVHFITH